MPKYDAAVLLIGHGSTLNADSSAPTYQHAEELRRRDLFAEVHVAFWKEEPNFRQALRQTAHPLVYLVPNFISSGYFTEQIIPRELGLTGAVTQRGGQTFYYCEPVGLHPAMTGALLQRAAGVVAESGAVIAEPARTACLFICGHGTSLNDNSTKIIQQQAEIIRQKGLFADCQGVLMEQMPFVRDWRTLTSCPDVIVVPFFISDGLHSFEDIPVLLGLTPNRLEQSFSNPQIEGERRLWYATAIGTDPFLADVIVAQIESMQTAHGLNGSAEASSSFTEDPITARLAEVARPFVFGQLRIKEDFSVRPTAALDRTEDLLVLTSLLELRRAILTDADGRFRPLRAAPNLRSDFVYHANDAAGLRAALEYIYPAAWENMLLWREGALPVTSWRETAERQTGRFRVVRELDDAALAQLVHDNCVRRCLKQRLWSPAPDQVEAPPEGFPLLCPEACNFLVGKAREVLKGSAED